MPGAFNSLFSHAFKKMTLVTGYFIKFCRISQKMEILQQMADFTAWIEISQPVENCEPSIY